MSAKKSMLVFILSLVCTTLLSSEEKWHNETLHPSWGQRIRIDHLVHEEHTDLQDLMIFDNTHFGRVLVLDGVIQLTEADEYVYHEMMAHVPLLAHGHARNVLIVGGGDGGALREVLRHPTVESVFLVEIDPSVVQISQQWLPRISNGAFNDPRLTLLIEDGALFVQNTEERFDVIICDSTDPTGPGAVLFTSAFYKNCKRILNPKGILVNQNGVPFLQSSEITDTYRNREQFFKKTTFYLAAVPTYAGGLMALGFATDCAEYLHLSEQTLQQRLNALHGKMNYYTPQIHHAAFALPPFIQELIPIEQITRVANPS